MIAYTPGDHNLLSLSILKASEPSGTRDTEHLQARLAHSFSRSTPAVPELLITCLLYL